jgi:RNA polymerase sigma-70 factor (ECF subfamily)
VENRSALACERHDLARALLIGFRVRVADDVGGPAETPANEHAFVQAVRAHKSLLISIAQRLCGNRADAEDLVHDAYERALRAWSRYAEQGNIRSWMVAIIHHLFIDRCRKARSAPCTTSFEALGGLEVATPEPTGPPVWTEFTPDQVEAALASIGCDFRRAYELHVAGRSYDEIAAELGIARSTVGTRLLRARKKLKAALLAQPVARVPDAPGRR